MTRAFCRVARRREKTKVSHTLHARLTVSRGVRQWQRAFQRDGRHCPRVKLARGFAPSGARRACTHVRMYKAEVRTRCNTRACNISHTRDGSRQTRITESEPGGRMINASATVDVHQIREGGAGGPPLLYTRVHVSEPYERQRIRRRTATKLECHRPPEIDVGPPIGR